MNGWFTGKLLVFTTFIGRIKQLSKSPSRTVLLGNNLNYPHLPIKQSVQIYTGFLTRYFFCGKSYHISDIIKVLRDNRVKLAWGSKTSSQQKFCNTSFNSFQPASGTDNCTGLFFLLQPSPNFPFLEVK